MPKPVSQTIQRLIKAAVNMFDTPWLAFVVASLVYLMISAYSGKLLSSSEYPYYNYLADAFCMVKPGYASFHLPLMT